jgi:hypothetical protein
MRSLIRKSIITAACLVGLVSAGAAQATVPVFETTTTTNSQSSFVWNAYGFSISNPGWYEATLTDNANPKAFESLALNILQGLNTTGLSLGGTLGPGTFSFLAKTSGAYTAMLFGVPGGGSGAGSFSISVVPEIETWVMLIIGAGLIAYQLRRKNKLDGPKLNLSFG